MLATYTEPSHLAYDLVLCFLPIFLLLGDGIGKRILLVLWFVIFIITFSGSGYACLFIFMFFCVFLSFHYYGKYKKVFLLLLIIIGLLFYFLLFKIENNYVYIIFNTLIKNLKDPYYWPISFLDRIQVYLILFYSAKNLDVANYVSILFGSGLGSDIRIASVLPMEIYDQIISVKSYESFLTSFLSKLFIYSGIVGFLWFIMYIYLLMYIAKNVFICSKLKTNYLISFVLTLAFTSMYTLGTFSFVSLWFVPSFLDAEYIRLKWERKFYSYPPVSPIHR